MATKDWERREDFISGNKVINWFKDGMDGGNVILIFPSKNKDIEPKPTWLVRTIPAEGERKEKSFKTKSQALRFARNYMRNH